MSEAQTIAEKIAACRDPHMAWNSVSQRWEIYDGELPIGIPIVRKSLPYLTFNRRQWTRFPVVEEPVRQDEESLA